ncbi:MAG: YebC/PmpR family DNA-binding transcriptional regulator [Deltaproteobacteria bacterium]|nr:YebC/PmpR family DNA-binding transcriptional regulator [Deltaproteobacteria bacterium]
MSGHSKWATIRRKKGAIDAKRGKIFTKLIREIQTAARMGGGSVDGNPRLRLAVEKARSENMPKDTIQRAIQKGSGGGDGSNFEEVVYEGYGPGGVAILIEGLTDNRTRTVGEVRHAFSKHGGNLGAQGCVSHLFEKKGQVVLEGVNGDALMEAALEAGADDVVEYEGTFTVVTRPSDLEGVKAALEKAGFATKSAEITMQASTQVPLTGDAAESMVKLAEALEDLDDVQNVHANFDIAAEELARIA